jgi:hypothetical protein
MKVEEKNEVVNDELSSEESSSTTVDSSSSSSSVSNSDNSETTESNQNCINTVKSVEDTVNSNNPITNDSSTDNNNKLAKSNTDSLVLTDFNSRKSIYDNHKWIDEDEDYYAYSENYTQLVGQVKKNDVDNEVSTLTITTSTVNANLETSNTIDTATRITPTPTSSVTSYQQLLFKSEKCINLTKSNSIEKADESSSSLVAPIATEDSIATTVITTSSISTPSAVKHKERDDFDDLIDLTNRPPKKENKTNSRTNSSTNLNEDNPNINAKASLPPLPYSFVKIEKSSKINNKIGSNNSLNNFKDTNTNNNKSASRTSTSTTRLFIPINNNNSNYNTNPKKEDKKNNNNINNNYNNHISIMPTTKSCDNLKINLNREPKTPIFNNNNNNNIVYFTSQINNNNGYMMMAGNGDSSINKSNINMTNRSNNTNGTNGQEWDQISKIFASLETLLNE